MRRNPKNDFESVYLRYNTVKKYLKDANFDLVNDEEFIKVCKSLTGNYYKKYRNILLISCFEFDDLYNLCQLFGLVFSGSVKDKQFKTKKDFNMIMMRFIGQRIQLFIQWSIRKFDTEEHVSSIESPSFDERYYYYYYAGEEKEVTLDDIYDKRDLMVFEKQFAKGIKRKDLNRKIQNENQKISIIEKKNRNKRMIQKQHFSECLSIIEQNIDKYKDQICYYATLRYTAKDVREYARYLCRKHNIDYKSWAKCKQKDGDESFSF